MNLFLSKRKVNVSKCCENFYESVFANVRDVELLQAFAKDVHDSVCDIAPSFNVVHLSRFSDELIGLQMECIGLAWFHKTKEKYAILQTEFTKEYLSKLGRNNVWECMEAYNSCVAESVTYKDQRSAIPRDKMRIVAINQARVDTYKRLIDQNHERGSAARYSNRIQSLPVWNDGLTQGLLAIHLTRRLKHEGSKAIWDRLSAVAYGFYRGMSDELGRVKIID